MGLFLILLQQCGIWGFFQYVGVGVVSTMHPEYGFSAFYAMGVLRLSGCTPETYVTALYDAVL